MSAGLMVLPASDATLIRLIRVPDDFEEHDAFRHVTGLIASAQSISFLPMLEVLQMLL